MEPAVERERERESEQEGLLENNRIGDWRFGEEKVAVLSEKGIRIWRLYGGLGHAWKELD